MGEWTKQTARVADARDMSGQADGSADLVVTSPPYPMVEMWDEAFSRMDAGFAESLARGDGRAAFLAAHGVLDDVWAECDRTLRDGGVACVIVGDATRTVGGEFQAFPNAARVTKAFFDMGYAALPRVNWRKRTNAPNKFLGSGTYPAGAYVTNETESVLLFRKGARREFDAQGRALRRKSAFFWEERNEWFSDEWAIPGAPQASGAAGGRERSAAFPLEIPFRLIAMHSVEGDVVLDPFLGTGTTLVACALTKRNGVGYETDAATAALAKGRIAAAAGRGRAFAEVRLSRHEAFVGRMTEEAKAKAHVNVPHGFLVKTRQETDIEIEALAGVTEEADGFRCAYGKIGARTPA